MLSVKLLCTKEMKKMKDLFLELDSSKTGFLTRNEMKKIASKKDFKMKKEQIDEILE